MDEDNINIDYQFTNNKFWQNLDLLREKINNRRNDLLKFIKEWYRLDNITLPRLLIKYEKIFGELELELLKKSKISLELRRRIELLNTRKQRGEKINKFTLEIIDKIIRKENELLQNKNINVESIIGNFSKFTNNKNIRFKSKTNFSNKNYFKDYQKHINSEFNCGFQNDTWTDRKFDTKTYCTELEFSRIYRAIVKRLHPDLSGNTDNFNRFWNDVQEAYKNDNLEKLKQFFNILCPEENNKIENIRIEEVKLRNLIKQLEVNIISEQHRIQQIKNDEPFNFQDKLNDNFWVAIRKLKLQKQIFDLNRDIYKNKKILNELNIK